MLRITTIMEDAKSDNGSLLSEHGLSLYIEFNGKNYLFDTGATGNFLDNAKRLGKLMDRLDAVIISHNHYDHGGGFAYLVEQESKLPKLYLGSDFFDIKYSRGERNRLTVLSSGITEDLLRKQDVEYEFVENTKQVSPGVWLLKGFEQSNDFEKPTKEFVREHGGKIEIDDFREEVVMVFETEKGLVLIVGCSHPGIINIITKVSKVFGKPIYALFGGTHQCHADRERIDKTLNICKDKGIGILGMCHCTGSDAEDAIKCDPEINGMHLAPGDTVLI